MENFEESEQIKREEDLPPQPSSKRKYLLIGVIIAVIVGAGILVLMQKKTPPQVIEPQVTEKETETNQYPNPCEPGQAPVYEGGEFSNCVGVTELPSGETADWQTYRNDEFGFEVKYPKDWAVVDRVGDIEIHHITPEGYLSDLYKFIIKSKQFSSADYEAMPWWLQGTFEKGITTIDGQPAPYVLGILTDKYGTYSAVYGVSGRDGRTYELLIYDHTPASRRNTLNQILSTFRFIENEEVALSTTCKDEGGNIPVITSLSRYSGPVGTELEIRGCNLFNFKGDEHAWIENEQGVRGFLYGKPGSISKSVKVTLDSPLCQYQIYVGPLYVAPPCDSWLTLSSGGFTIYVTPWSQKSNEISFTIQ